MLTQNYWINRANQRMDAYILQSEQTADEIAKAYYKASKQIEKEMAKVLNGLSAISDPQTAVRALKSNPAPKLITQLRKAVGAMPDGKEKQEALTLISSPAYQFRLRRLQATLDNAKKECERLYKAELKGATRHLRGLYNDAFLHTAYDIDKGYNLLHTFSMFPASRVNKLLTMQWSGLNYSERIWNSTQDLANTLKEQMLIAFMTGAGVSSTARAISKQFQTSAYNARRLVRTETNFIANQAEMDAYKRLGIEQYKYIATLDTRTSAVCQSLDGQVFSCDDAQAGVNLPPMHPNCRSTTIMYDAEQPLKERVARDENGNTIRVPGDTTYKQWMEKYHPELVDKSAESGIIGIGSGIHSILSSVTFPYIGNFESKVRLEVQEMFNEEYSKAVEKYGNISTINRVETLNTKSSALGEYNDNSRIISLRYAGDKNYSKILTAISQKMKKDGEWSTGNVRHAMRHEIGHAIILEHRLNDDDWDDKLQKITVIYEKALDSENDDYTLPSNYSDGDVDEFISECIAAGYNKKQTATVKEVVDIIVRGV